MISLVIFFLFTAAVDAILLPNATGPFEVAMKVQAMTDYKRTNAFFSPQNPDNRKLLTSVFWPVDDTESCSHVRVPYYPPATAELFAAGFAAQSNLTAASQFIKDTLSGLELGVCEVSKASGCGKSASAPRYPLAIFSPGLRDSRLEYSVIARSVASRGYVVVTVDHPYDASIVEFPDGSVVMGAHIDDNDEKVMEELVKIRQDDMSFVLSQFQYESASSPLLQEVANKVDFGKVVAFGHSLGGAAAASVMMADTRFRAGVNMDGNIREPVLSKGLDGAFLQLGQADRQTKDKEHTWSKFWDTLRGPKAELEIFGTVHTSFTDLALVVDHLGLPTDLKALLTKVTGTTNGARLEAILIDTLTSFFAIVSLGSPVQFIETVARYNEIYKVCVRVD